MHFFSGQFGGPGVPLRQLGTHSGWFGKPIGSQTGGSGNGTEDLLGKEEFMTHRQTWSCTGMRVNIFGEKALYVLSFINLVIPWGP